MNWEELRYYYFIRRSLAIKYLAINIQQSPLKADGETIEFRYETGITQEDALSGVLFNWIMEKTCEESKTNDSLECRHSNWNLIILQKMGKMARNKVGLQRMLH